jgi:glyoxylase-like metal-dependent hydrolase (beta-lactamase superfamily II)
MYVMKQVFRLVLVVVLLGLGALGWSFTPARLEVGDIPKVLLPESHPPAGMSLHAIEAGYMVSNAAFAYRGGSFLDSRRFGMGGILVQHPKGTLLFDTGFGSTVDQQFKTIPWLMQVTTHYVKEPTVAAQLAAAHIPLSSITGVVLTHAHWDHVSGLVDLPGVPVWINRAEQDFIRNGGDATALIRSMGALPYKLYAFTSGPYLGFTRSLDVFGDGSVVLVPAPGHTPGSIIAFVNTPDGKRYALVGDLVWQTEGIAIPAERPWISRMLVDWDSEDVRDLIVQMHKLQAAIPGLIIVPAHDRRVWERLPQLGS